MRFHLFSSDTRKARKNHDCIWCREDILTGETYQDERSVYDGNIQRHRWHPECQKASFEYFREAWGPEFDRHAFKRGTTEEA